jgi:hypothetical protein
MGLSDVSLPQHGRVFLPAGQREELLAPATEPEEPPPFRVSPFLRHGDYEWPHVLEPLAWSHYFGDGDQAAEEGRVLRVEWSAADGWQVWQLRHVAGSPPRWGSVWEHDRLLRQAADLAGLVPQKDLPEKATALYPALAELMELAGQAGVKRLLWDCSPGNLGMDQSLRMLAVMSDGEPHELATTLTMVPDGEGVLVVAERSTEETLPEATKRLRQLAH